MDVATVPFTVVTYSEPHRETAVELHTPPAENSQSVEQAVGSSYAPLASPFQPDDGSDSDSDSAGSDGRERTADERLALELQQDELRKSGMSPAGQPASL